jgi:aldehyde dehydrogenase (NAD+)
MTAVIDTECLRSLFPGIDEIPLEHRPPAPIHQRCVLVNGELRTWHGPCQTVLSPIRVRNDAGDLEPVELGSYPEGSEHDSEEALVAALAAYDDGRGTWPTMTVGERIACMQEFTAQMLARRSDVVRLIMWEISKSRADSEKGVRPNDRLQSGPRWRRSRSWTTATRVLSFPTALSGRSAARLWG